MKEVALSVIHLKLSTLKSDCL